MYALQASLLLKDVICPYCKHDIAMERGSPFRVFDPNELSSQCDKKKCVEFLSQLSEHFRDFDKGEISDRDFHSWLDQFKNNKIN
jgi:hypothetical protein